MDTQALQKTHQWTFETDGVVFPLPLLSAKELTFYNGQFKGMEDAFGGQLPYAGNVHKALDWAYDLCVHPKVLKQIRPILGNDICVVGSLMLTKYPKTENYVSWHQDGMNSHWDQEHSLTVWVAFTKSHSGNGCMQVIPSSHKNKLQDHVYFTDTNNLIRKGHKIAVEVDASDALNLELEAGMFSIHHNSIIHGSKANRSDDKRIGFIIRYVSTKHVSPDTSVIYASGSQRDTQLQTIERPVSKNVSKNLEAYKSYLTKSLVVK